MFGFILLPECGGIPSQVSTIDNDLFISAWVVVKRGLFLAQLRSEMKARVVVLMWVVFCTRFERSVHRVSDAQFSVWKSSADRWR